MKRSVLVVSLALLAGCPGTPSPGEPARDGGLEDAGPPDAGGLDAGGSDAGTFDAGPADGGPPDASVPDAGVDAGERLPRGDRDLRGAPIPDALPLGAYAGITACELLGGTPAPGLGGLAPCGSYAVPVGACSEGMQEPIRGARLFVHEELQVGNTYLGGNDLRFGQEPNVAFVMKFRPGGAGQLPVVGGLPPGVVGQLGFVFAQHPNRGEVAVRFATLSTRPCDFDYARLDAGDPCFQRLAIAGGGALFVDVAPDGVSSRPGCCTVRPGTVYYLSLRWEDPAPATRGRVSCRPTPGSPTFPYCGTSLALQ